VVQNVIFPVGVAIVFCFLFYRAVSGSSSGSSVLGFSQREDLEEDLLEGGYENYMQSVSENVPESVPENDIKSSI
jgi:hypothetical protein